MLRIATLTLMVCSWLAYDIAGIQFDLPSGGPVAGTSVEVLVLDPTPTYAKVELWINGVIVDSIIVTEIPETVFLAVPSGTEDLDYEIIVRTDTAYGIRSGVVQ